MNVTSGVSGEPERQLTGCRKRFPSKLAHNNPSYADCLVKQQRGAPKLSSSILEDLSVNPTAKSIPAAKGKGVNRSAV
ncbi:hypothetical protein NLI96_g10504 [Meripilus lineatus]|uniref:Uncharacterized protein n=1 Tax=Meripilus lineatus TaxID=2056292 RepID=A0AAD5Y987_9APHY|nr:hypothetical protein NLI96_g10504 [Physisporinus lineatus]